MTQIYASPQGALVVKHYNLPKSSSSLMFGKQVSLFRMTPLSKYDLRLDQFKEVVLQLLVLSRYLRGLSTCFLYFLV